MFLELTVPPLVSDETKTCVCAMGTTRADTYTSEVDGVLTSNSGPLLPVDVLNPKIAEVVPETQRKYPDTRYRFPACSVIGSICRP